VKRLLAIATLVFILLASCGGVPSLWGTYPTPTLEAALTLPPFDPPPASPSASFTPSPTPTPTPPPAVETPSAALTPEAQATAAPTSDAPLILYYSQSGDTLGALAARFNVLPEEIRAEGSLPASALIHPGTLLIIPSRIEQPTTPNVQILPDSEVVLSASAIDFDIAAYIRSAAGVLSTYQEYLGSSGWTNGAQAIRRLAYENSIHPRLLLAVLEYESRWVRGRPVDILHADYPMGYQNPLYKGLFAQMVWAVNQLSIGYYGWRSGSLTELHFLDGTTLRLEPRLNAGTVAIQYLFAQTHSPSQWAQILNPESGFPAVYMQMFGDPWARPDALNPIFPPGLSQPPLSLPFEPNIEWSFTGGPHGAWEHDGALAAVDFAPATDHSGCTQTQAWVTAAAPGLIVRSENGVVVEDLDGDGYEQTGWNLLYLHVATPDRVETGTWVEKDERIGHPSCEGGIATGTHLHFARKYNGEWVAADGPLPFVLSGWIVHAGSKPYEGTLTRGDQTVVADPVGQAKSVIYRDENER